MAIREKCRRAREIAQEYQKRGNPDKDIATSALHINNRPRMSSAANNILGAQLSEVAFFGPRIGESR
jgi:hypothetical protein